MFLIYVPDTYLPERKYIISIFFSDFLGLNFKIIVSDRENVLILKENDSASLEIKDSLFSINLDYWLTPNSLPSQPLKSWSFKDIGPMGNVVATSFDIPVIYGEDPTTESLFRQSEKSIYLGIDILGSSFFMLTRYEEIVKTDRDQYDRFPIKAALAYQEGFLERPIVNEYLEILWVCLKILWPTTRRKERKFSVKITHDVDNPFQLKPLSFKKWIRNMAGDLVVRKEHKLALSLLFNGCLSAMNLPCRDRFDTFVWLMDISESANTVSAFYFICGHSESDPRYDVNSEHISHLIEKIAHKGHEIGIHPSFETYLQPNKLYAEVNTLRSLLEEKRIEQIQIGGRQHYLRWSASETWQHWENAELSYDSSLAFAEGPGFRCGTCYQYPVYSLMRRRKLNLKESPLILMEMSLLSKKYTSINNKEFLSVVKHLINTCKLFQGEFTYLWHNDQLYNTLKRDLYQKMVSLF